jgi:hypothetical protein
MPIADMELRLTERNARLRKIKEPSLILAEGFGARLYTGPLFTKVGLPTARTTLFHTTLHFPQWLSAALKLCGLVRRSLSSHTVQWRLARHR